MRKITLIIIASISVLLLSCKDELDLKPFDKLEEELALSTPKDFTTALNGAYIRFLGGTDGDYYPRKMILSDVLTDNLIMCQDGRHSLQNFYEYKLDANSTASGIMFYAYSSTDRVNRIIENIDALSDGDFKDDVLGQAKAVRALNHLDIVMFYAPSFKAVNPDDANTGIPIKNKSDALAKPARNTLNETFDFIISELKEAKNLISNDRSAVAEGVINRAAVSTILARAYLYKGDFANAKAEAQDAIDLVGSADLAIGSLEEFPYIWTDNSAGNAGVLFKILVQERDRTYPGWEFNQEVNNVIASEYVVTLELYNKYGDDDVRKAPYFRTDIFNGNLYNHIIKYLRRPSTAGGVVDVKVVRGAEAYLILAEAAARTGDNATALDALDEVRSRRYEDFESGGESGEALLNAVMLEKRLEFAFEGQRLFDLKRLGLPVHRSETDGDRADGSGFPAPASARELEPNDHKFTLPVPTSEIQANPNFTQSPGY